MLECVVNVSEGRDDDLLEALARTSGDVLLDLHRDPDHHRAVLTLGGNLSQVEGAARALTAEAVGRLDLQAHRGIHPRFGAVDVVPFVALAAGPTSPGLGPDPAGPDLVAGDPLLAVGARDRFAAWAADTLDLPCFLYGPLADGSTRTLPEVRRGAFRTLDPDLGPRRPHPSAGAVAVGARPPLVAYNLWVAGTDLEGARRVATEIRSPWLRALGLAVGRRLQVSCNLVDPWVVGPAEAYDLVADTLQLLGGRITGAELVGLAPRSVLRATTTDRWPLLDLSPDATVERRLATGWFRKR